VENQSRTLSSIVPFGALTSIVEAADLSEIKPNLKFQNSISNQYIYLVLEQFHLFVLYAYENVQHLQQLEHVYQ
jgi:hypothetical protein